MNKSKKLGMFLVLFLLSATLVACGTAKDKAQGTWNIKNDENAQIEIKDDSVELVYLGLSTKGKIVEDDKDHFVINLEGEKYEGEFRDDKLFIEDDELVKVD
ncbi:hypothetical protein [Mammaliicoccus sp. E-M21]|uniref:hypothetical protein n=1 Tax=Mammaliicoccus sp. E-M21 TaxID=2898681 RepID=UPI001EFBA059|nr:hypothetical protein [Mammaliicoccus sp. E-M21]